MTTQRILIAVAVLLLLVCGYYLYQFNYGNYSGEEISIERSRGDYISADRFKENLLIANRSTVSEWETFQLVRLNSDQVAILASDRKYIGADSKQPFYVRARNSTLEVENKLTLIEKETGSFLIQNHDGKYFRISDDDQLIIGSNSPSDAEHFHIQKVEKESPPILLDHQITLLSIGLFICFLSILVFQYSNDKKVDVFLLFAGSLFVRLFMIELAHYLHIWDEQFHALVAKNMMDHPFKPMLFANPTLAFNSTSWIGGHVWLHKQPLFLWQMAMSMKVFGVNTLALRLPSAIMLSLVVPMIYRMGKIGFSQRAGYFGALLFALSHFSILLSGGAIHTDHNDAAFLFYVAASVWAWFEYENSNSVTKKYWILLIGLFSGCAVLVKWLTGLLVFSGWGMATLLSEEKRMEWRNYLHMLVAFCITVVVFLPWQLYIMKVFPEVAAHESSMITRHFFESIENHGEDFWYHFIKLDELYGVSKYLILICVLVFLRSIRVSAYKVAVVTVVLVTYLFFSFAITKMIAFTFCISFLIYLIIGIALDKFFNAVILNKDILSKKIQSVLYTTFILCAVSYVNLDLDSIIDTYSSRKTENSKIAESRKKSTHVIQQLPNHIPNISNCVLFNCKFEDSAPVLFFTDVLDAHTGIPSKEVCRKLKEKGHTIAVFDNGSLPWYIFEDPQIVLINEGYYN